jgi:hypothetical protein
MPINAIPIKREATQLQSGDWLVTVTPPEWTDFPPSSLTLTPGQFHRFNEWLEGGTLIQNALPDLSPAEREILMTGIGAAEWDREFPDDDT